MHVLRNKLQWLDGLWLFLLALYILAGAAVVPFHGDESTVIYLGRDYYLQFIEGDISKLLYDETETIVSPTDQHLRLLNSAIAKNVSGWVLYQNGIEQENINEQWDWGADYGYNRDTHRIPDTAILIQTRVASSIQLIVAVISLFWVAKHISNRPTAYLASLYFVLNPNILMNGRRAMTEGSHLMGLMLIMLVAVWIINQRKWWGFIILGIVTGFGIASKHPNAIVTALVFIAYVTHPIIQIIRHQESNWHNIIRTISGLGFAGILTLLVFYALNPIWWEKPIEVTQQALIVRNDLLQDQMNTFGSYATLGERFTGLFEFVFVAQPQYYEVEVWATYGEISAQITTYQQSIWSGLPIGGTTFGGWIVMLIASFGFIQFILNTNIVFHYRWLIAVCSIGMITLTFLLTPLPWARYYLPIAPFLGLSFGYGVSTLATIFWKRITQ